MRLYTNTCVYIQLCVYVHINACTCTYLREYIPIRLILGGLRNMRMYTKTFSFCTRRHFDEGMCVHTHTYVYVDMCTYTIAFLAQEK